MEHYYLIFFIFINVLSSIMMFVDKSKAKQHGQRISEKNFMILSLLGGFLGIYFGGLISRHKTSKRSFQIKIVLAMLVHIIILYFFYNSL